MQKFSCIYQAVKVDWGTTTLNFVYSISIGVMKEVGPTEDGARLLFLAQLGQDLPFYVYDQIHYSFSGHCFHPLVVFNYKISGLNCVGCLSVLLLNK